MSEIKKQTINEIASAGKDVSTVISEAKAAIDELDPEINAFIEVFEDVEDSHQQAEHILSGIPVAVKDNILIKGHIASAASGILANYTATYDAFVIKLLKKAGALIMGRTNMDEAAMGSSTETSFYGVTKNPLDKNRVPGGSSGGPAAAVAAGMVPYALGSDTGGSIRQPAAYCGLVGMKPTYGAVSRSGLIAMCSSLDVIGPLSHNVQDAQTVFNAISGYDEEDSTCVPMNVRVEYQKKNNNTKRVGVPRSFLNQEGIDPEVLENFEEALDRMEKAGYEIVDLELPSFKYSLAVYYIIQPAEASSNLSRYDGIRFGLSVEGEDLVDGYLKTKTEGFGKEVKRRIMLGTHVLSSGYHDEYYYKALQVREQITAQTRKAFGDVDVIMTPTTPSVAFEFGAKQDPLSMYMADMFTVPANLSGNPAISVPSGHNTKGMPFGIHFTAPMFCEDKLFEIAQDFEGDVS